MKGYNFGEALALLKAGHRVARESWNGKGMWLFLNPGLTSFGCDDMQEMSGLRQDEIEELPYICMVTVDKKIVPWLASQTDLLVEDWVVLTD